jgi:hypothetical protein
VTHIQKSIRKFNLQPAKPHPLKWLLEKKWGNRFSILLKTLVEKYFLTFFSGNTI